MLLDIRPVIWLGNSRQNVRNFPKKVRVDMGAALMAAQCGGMAEHVKPLKGVGSGVFEILDSLQQGGLSLGVLRSARAACLRSACL